jgi:hypothetical protein
MDNVALIIIIAMLIVVVLPRIHLYRERRARSARERGRTDGGEQRGSRRPPPPDSSDGGAGDGADGGGPTARRGDGRARRDMPATRPWDR